MATYIPITLVGNSLGERHRHLNALVNDAYQKKTPFETIQNIPELSAVDRLFKIDLASKLRHLQYILDNLKDNDMLYVNRALCTWLLEPQYRDVINPTNLEAVIYPDMTKTAVNKMNSWLHVHLKDPSRCQEFFEYYNEKNFDTALKFLWNCPAEVISDKMEKILNKITPKRMRLLCEKCPRAVRIFYDLMPKNKDVLYKYLCSENDFYCCLTNLINTDSNLLLDIAEKYYNSNRCSAFSSTITREVMSKHKDRYVKKPELYSAWFLHLPTLAKYLNDDEIKDVVLRLARAEYLGGRFFSYKRVEPLIKRLSHQERAAFKKLVFVDKSIGEKVKDWPYEPPTSPKLQGDDETHIFIDKKFVPDGVGYQLESCMMRCGVAKRKYGRWIQMETLLDKLFNKYRCISFKNTFFELSKQIPAESSVQTREYMMLVLVSKTGGNVEYLKDVLELLVSRHHNEADNFRATITRSLVKRAKAWRLPNELWQLLLKFARGLGLDGEKSDERCFEGLHAVVLRNILLDEECSPKVFSAYVNQFSTFSEYALNENEKRKVIGKLPLMLLASAKEQTKTTEAILRLEAVMRVLNDYNLKIQHCPDFVPVISTLAHKDSEACMDLLKQLYNARIARKDLYRENFDFLQSDESYVNVLRHDVHILLNTDKFGKLATEKINHDRFLRKLAIYFAENEGLASNYLRQIEKEMVNNPRGDLCRSYALLVGSALIKQLQEVDKVVDKTAEQKRLAVTLRACGHLARPKLDLNALGWRVAGVKAVANQTSICSTNKVKELIDLLINWPRTLKLAYLLAERIGKECDILSVIAHKKPTVAIKITLSHLKQRGEAFDPNIWKIGKGVLERVDLSQPKHVHLREKLADLSKVPESIKADYGAVIYKAFRNVKRDERIQILVDMEDYLLKADEAFLVDVMKEFMDTELNLEEAMKTRYSGDRHVHLIIRTIAKFLLLCKHEETQKQRMESVGKPFLSHMKKFFDDSDKSSRQLFMNYWNSFTYGLKCTDVYLDTSFVSCLPVMQNVVEWLKENISIVEHVDVYGTIHLTMLYFKTLRQSIKQNPEIFADKSKRNDIGVQIAGVMYGKYIAHEIIQLKTEYFDSIVEIYAKVLISYFSDVFAVCDSFWPFVSGLVRGLVEEKDSSSLVLAEKIFAKHRDSLKSHLENDKTLDLLKGIDDKQLQFFLNEDLPDTLIEC